MALTSLPFHLGRGVVGWVGEGVAKMCVFIHNRPRYHSQANPNWAPATLVSTESFISSPISGPLFPLGFWIGFKTFTITTVTGEQRACETEDRLIPPTPLPFTCLTP